MLVIDSKSSGTRYWKDIWDFRELIYFLSWRDILVRYKQTTIGLLWTIIRPLLVMIALTLVFGRLANFAAQQEAPYPLLVLTGLLPWLFFANTLTDCSESLVANANLVSKIYFPRIIIPIASTFVSLFEFAITLTLLSGVLIWYSYSLSWNLLALPIFIFLGLSLSFGAGLWISAFNVKYRDFRYIIPFALQFGLYVTPVGYSSAIISEKWRLWVAINPLVGIIDGFRWSILGSSQTIYWPATAMSVVISLSILAGGIRYFRTVERHFADII